MPRSDRRSTASGTSTSESRSISSSRIRLPDTVDSAPSTTATRAARSVSSVILNPRRVSKRTARSRRVGSSRKLPS